MNNKWLRALRSRVGTVLLVGCVAVGTVGIAGDASAASTVAATTTSTPPTLTFSSGIQIQNLNTTTPANVTLTYTSADGLSSTLEPTSGMFQIPAGASCTIYGPVSSSLPAPVNGTVCSSSTGLPMTASPGFNGSVVISADAPVAAIVDLLGANGSTTVEEDGYGGVSTPAQTVSLPLIESNYYGLNTTVYIQNTTASPVTGTITFTSAGTSAFPAGQQISENFSIGANSTLTLSQSTDSKLNAGFVGSAVITTGGSSQLVAAVVNQSYFDSVTGANVLISNTGLGGSGVASNTIYAPLIENNNHGLYTGLSVQNTNAQQVTVQLHVDGAAQGSPVSIPGYGAHVFNTLTPGSFPGVPANGSLHSASVVQTGGGTGADLIGIVDVAAFQVSTIDGKSHESSASAYLAAGSSSVTGTVSVPLVQSNDHGLFTGETVQNLDSAPAMVTFSAGGFHDTQTIQPGQSGTWVCIPSGSSSSCQYQGAAGTVKLSDLNGIPSKTSATITAVNANTSSPGKIIGIFQQALSGATFDAQTAFNALNQ